MNLLLVDDHADTRDEMRRMLAEIGLVVEVAETAAKAQIRVLETTFDALVLDFCESTYAAAADLGDWDRAALECPQGNPGICRSI